MELPRSAGVLLHITSLPGDYGIGDLGRPAFRFIEWLKEAGQQWWQMLPLGPTDMRGNPYASPSSWAGLSDVLDLEHLAEHGDLTAEELAAARVPQSAAIDYLQVKETRARLLHLAAARFFERAQAHDLAEFEEFCRREQWWLDDWVCFAALQSVYPEKFWWQWEQRLALHDPDALCEFARAEGQALRREQYVQFRFHQQWERLRGWAKAAGIRLIGDLPIYCARHSQDVWAHRDKFKLDAHGNLLAQSGVPPDYFSATGQLWGTPVYDWPAHQADDFAWWASRLRGSLARVDLLRIDHFRGLVAYWEVPPNDDTAINGSWQPGPGDEFFAAINKRLGEAPFIAEDLGIITEDVIALRDRWNLPGMRVLQFAFGGGGAENIYLPHHHVPHCLIYTGTHDNDTTLGWYRSAGRKERAMFRRYSGHDGPPEAVAIRMAYASVAQLAVAPMQDVLGLGSEARQNIPGSELKGGNYRWKLVPEQLSTSAGRPLRYLAALYGRLGHRPS